MNLNDLKLCQFAVRTCRGDSARNENPVDRAPRTDCRSTRTDPALATNIQTRGEFEAWENHSDNEQSLVATSVMEMKEREMFMSEFSFMETDIKKVEMFCSCRISLRESINLQLSIPQSSKGNFEGR